MVLRIRLHQMLAGAIFCIAMMLAASSFGQDASSQELGVTENDRDKVLYSPGEGETRFRSSSGVAKDSAMIVRPQTITTSHKAKTETTPKSGDKSAPKEDSQDSILSFNFLYYIIQKYKLQDIVD